MRDPKKKKKKKAKKENERRFYKEYANEMKKRTRDMGGTRKEGRKAKRNVMRMRKDEKPVKSKKTKNVSPNKAVRGVGKELRRQERQEYKASKRRKKIYGYGYGGQVSGLPKAMRCGGKAKKHK